MSASASASGPPHREILFPFSIHPLPVHNPTTSALSLLAMLTVERASQDR